MRYLSLSTTVHTLEICVHALVSPEHGTLADCRLHRAWRLLRAQPPLHRMYDMQDNLWMPSTAYTSYRSMIFVSGPLVLCVVLLASSVSLSLCVHVSPMKKTRYDKLAGRRRDVGFSGLSGYRQAFANRGWFPRANRGANRVDVSYVCTCECVRMMGCDIRTFSHCIFY